MAGMRRLLALTCSVVFVDTVFYAALTPLVPYFTDNLGLSKSAVGVLSGAFGAGVLLGSAPGGYLAGRVGVRATAVGGLLLVAFTSFTFGLADEAWQLVALRLASGVGSALGWVAALTWLSEQVPEGRRGEMIGMLLSAVVGTLLGPVLGGAAVAVGITLAFASVSLFAFTVAVWALLTSGPAPVPGKPFWEVLAATRRTQILTGLAFVAFSPLLFGALAVLAPLQLSQLGWGAAAIGAVFLVAALFEAVVHPLLGRWSDRSGHRTPVLAGILVGSLAVLLALPWAEYTPLVALLVVLAGIFFNAPLVPGTYLLSQEAEKASIGGAPTFGATNFAWASGYAVGTSMGGSLADLGGDVLSYLSLAAVCLLALLLLTRAA